MTHSSSDDAGNPCHSIKEHQIVTGYSSRFAVPFSCCLNGFPAHRQFSISENVYKYTN